MLMRVLFIIALASFHTPTFGAISMERQDPKTEQQTSILTKTPGSTAMREYKGVKLGINREQVKRAMDRPSRSDKQLEEFKLGDGDLMTVHYDDKDIVKTIQLYFTDPSHAPDWKEVVCDVEIENKPNGSKFARAVVQDENFWVTMYQSNGGSVTTITISR